MVPNAIVIFLNMLTKRSTFFLFVFILKTNCTREPGYCLVTSWELLLFAARWHLSTHVRWDGVFLIRIVRWQTHFLATLVTGSYTMGSILVGFKNSQQSRTLNNALQIKVYSIESSEICSSGYICARGSKGNIFNT